MGMGPTIGFKKLDRFENVTSGKVRLIFGGHEARR